MRLKSNTYAVCATCFVQMNCLVVTGSLCLDVAAVVRSDGSVWYERWKRRIVTSIWKCDTVWRGCLLAGVNSAVCCTASRAWTVYGAAPVFWHNRAPLFPWGYSVVRFLLFGIIGHEQYVIDESGAPHGKAKVWSSYDWSNLSKTFSMALCQRTLVWDGALKVIAQMRLILWSLRVWRWRWALDYAGWWKSMMSCSVAILLQSCQLSLGLKNSFALDTSTLENFSWATSSFSYRPPNCLWHDLASGAAGFAGKAIWRCFLPSFGIRLQFGRRQ